MFPTPRLLLQEEKTAFASEQIKTVSEKVALSKLLEESQQNYGKLKLENDLAQAELKRMQLLNQRSLVANRKNAYKRDVARIHYDYAEAAKKKAEQRQLEQKLREKRLADSSEDENDASEDNDFDSNSSDKSAEGDAQVEIVGRSITDFGRRLFNIALDL